MSLLMFNNTILREFWLYNEGWSDFENGGIPNEELCNQEWYQRGWQAGLREKLNINKEPDECVSEA